ncbi:hypothetical protein [Succinimonas sp.]|uniref:hypothetical protein n=1 Tax=Succinimonas sp. TaxID=1936151 RepID=UPI003868A3DB
MAITPQLRKAAGKSLPLPKRISLTYPAVNVSGSADIPRQEHRKKKKRGDNPLRPRGCQHRFQVLTFALRESAGVHMKSMRGKASQS